MGSLESALPPDFLRHHGLSRDPFDDRQVEGLFFPEGGRLTLLEQLLHYSQFGDTLLLVTGEPGAGKTTLKYALLDQLPPETPLCAIDATVMTGAEQLLGQIAQELAVPTHGGRSPAALAAAIQAFDDQEGLPAVVVVDDAHLLGDDALEALLLLLAPTSGGHPPVHLVLLAEPGLAPQLEQRLPKHMLLHHLALRPFDAEEVKAYLDYRLQQAGLRGRSPINKSLAEHFWERSGGWPGELHPLVRQWLAHQASEGGGSVTLGLPTGHMLAIVAVAATLLALVLWNQWGGDDEAEPPAVTATDNLVVPPEPVPAQPDRPASNETPPLAQGESGMTESPAERVEVEAEPSPAPQPAPEPEPEPEPAPESQPAPQPEPEPTPAPEPEPDPLAQLPADERTLLGWDPTHFTLQVLGASDEAAVRRFIDAQGEPAAFLYYRTLRNGERWFVVVHGDYSDKAAAREAIAQLPPVVRDAGPWPRPVADIQGEIRRYRGL